MKKIMIYLVAAIFFVSPFVAASTSTVRDSIKSQGILPMPTSEFTHTVFLEEGTATWCPNCPNAAEALYSIYNSSEYPFYYIALVYDESKVAKNRLWGHYQGYEYPCLFLDGGFSQLSGSATTPQQTEELYRPEIESVGARMVHPLEVSTNVTGHNDAKLDITVTVKNTGNKIYIGILRSAVTEIVSRWITQKGHPYHFALLDYALKKIVIIPPQQTKTYTATFDGAAQHGNLTFSDIVDDNIMVISTVFHWLPHFVARDDYIWSHVAFYVDQADGATVN
jgi:small nuclear ribonucleoprotein (snRNP)-like protein